MKIEVYSDLHLEFYRGAGRDFISKMQPNDIDVLVLAGDITTCKNMNYVIPAICNRYKNSHVLYVAGNHEHYHSSFYEVSDALYRLEQKHENLSWLNNRRVEFGGKVFCGSTLWFKEQPTTELYKGGLNDFEYIKDFELNVYDENKKAYDFISLNLDSDVVITHHAPLANSIQINSSNALKRQFWNHFYFTDFSALLLAGGPKLWVHGHLHNPVDYVFGQTRVFSNPKGYPGRENADYVARRIIELD